MFVKLVEDVKAYGGEVLMFSSMHESGQRESLDQQGDFRLGADVVANIRLLFFQN